MNAHTLDIEAIAQRLEQARRRSGLSYVDLHRKLEAATPAGQECVTDEAVRRYCKGETWPLANGANFLRLCQVLGESPLWVLFAVRMPKVSGNMDLAEDEITFVALYRALPPGLRQSLLEMAQALSGQVSAAPKAARSRGAPRVAVAAVKKPRGGTRWPAPAACAIEELTLF